MLGKKDNQGMLDPKTVELVALTKFELLSSFCHAQREKVLEVSKLANFNNS